MQHFLLALRRLLPLVLAWGASYAARSQTYTPVTLGGFNHDVIVSGNNNGTSNTAVVLSTYDVDGSGAGYCFMSANYVNTSNAANNAPNKLPDSGSFTSVTTAGLPYQLASFTGNNVLRVPATATASGGTGAGADAGTVSFVPSVAATTVYVLATGGGGAVTNGMTVTATFSDGTKQVLATNATLNDWFASTGTVGYQGFGRVARTAASAIDNASSTTPRLFEFSYTIASPTKPIASLTFGKTITTGGAINVFAVTIVPTTSGVTTCSGTPTAGSTTATASSIALTAYNTLSLTGATTDAGLTYQWQYSYDNASWTNLPAYPSGAATAPASPYSQNPTASTCSVTNQTVDTYYRCVVTCTNGGASSPSTKALVTSSIPTNYCAATSTSTNEYLTNVTLGTINNSSTNQTSTAVVNYTTSPTATQTTNLNAGGSYPLSVQARSNAAGSSAAVWVDFNRNGTFETSEFTLIGSAPASGSPLNYTPQLLTFTAALNVPTTALVGPTRMRVRWKNGLATSSEACTAYGGGETEDYLVTLQSATACTSGTVPAVTGAPASSCPGVAFSLSAGDPPSASSGVAYQWQSSPAGAGTFTNLSTTTYPSAATVTLVISQTAATDYRVQTTCGGSTATSAAVTVGLTPFNNCYCTPSTANVPTTYAVASSPQAYLSSSGGCGTSGAVPTLNVADLSNNPVITLTPGCVAASPYYVNNTAQAGSLTQAGTYTVSGTLGATTRAVLWIDYDHSGTFDASEYVLLGTNTGSSAATFSATFTVASGSLTGSTRLRLKTEASSGSLLTNTTTNMGNSCVTTGTAGQTQDFAVTITASTACAGTPPAVTATPSATSVCAGTTFTLTASGLAAGTTGLTYQWQSSPAGAGTFTNVPATIANPDGTTTTTNATTPVVTISYQQAATDYRVLVTCTNSGQTTVSSVATVGQNAAATCYCTPTAGGTSSYGKLFPVAIAATGRPTPVFTTSSVTTSTTSPNYLNYTNTASNPTGTLNIGGTYTLSGGLAPNTRASAWIDYNQNGVFEASEFTQLVGTTATSYNFPFAVSFTVPTTALAGTTRLRLRTDYYGNTVLATGTNACASTTYGLTVDYTVTLAPTPACVAGTVFQAVASSGFVSSTANSGRTVTLSVPGVPAGITGLTYQWQSRSGSGAFTSVSGATGATYTVADQAATTDYQVLLTCGGTTTASLPVTVYNSIEGTFGAVLSNPGGEFLIDFQMLNDVNGGGFDQFNGAIRSTSTTGYTDYTGNPAYVATLNRGVQYTGTQVSGFLNSSPTYTGLWIDANQNGTFEASEYTALGSGANASGAPATFPGSTLPATGQTNPNPISITLPATSPKGPVRVRVRWRNGSIAAASDATVGSYSATSGSAWYGATADYLIMVQDPATCTAPPNPVTASSNQANACANGTITLTATNIPTTTSGYTYQWQSSPAGAGTFTNVPVGGTASTSGTAQSYITTQTAATDYQLIVGCQYGGTPVTSNVVSVGQNSFDQCYSYCPSSHTPGCDTGGATITNVALNTLNSPSGCAAAAPYLTVFPASGSTTTSLTMGGTYTLTVSNTSNPTVNGGYYYGVWIDYDHSGSFDTGEFIPNTYATSPTTATSTSVSFTVPVASASVLAGPTRMRIVSDNAASAFYGPFAAGDGCSTGRIGGETEEYTITLVAAPDLVINTPGQTVAAGTYNSITVQNGGVGTLAGNVTVLSSTTVQNGGTLNDGCAILSGAGTFTLAAGGTLGICQAAGISSSGATGTVQVTGARSFSPDASYVYNGTVAQSTGSGLPGQVRNLTTTNGSNLTLTGATSATQVVTVGGAGNLVLNGKALTLLSSASGTALIVNSSTGLVTGTTGVAQRYLATPNLGLGYRQYSAPVSGSTVADLATVGFTPEVSQASTYNASATPGAVRPYPTVFGYDQLRLATTSNNLDPFNKGWYVPASTGASLGVGLGYTVNIAGTELVDFVGTFTSGIVGVALSRGPSVDAGLALVGNPYPAPLDWSLVQDGPDRTGLDGTIWVFASSGQYAGSYRTYTNGQGGNPIVPMGQGFFVRVTPGQSSGSITFRNSHRLTAPDATAMQRTADLRPRLTLELRSPGGSADPLIAYTQAGATTGVDAEFDAIKLSNPSGLNLSSTAAAGERLAIDGRPAFVAGTELPLQVGVPAAGTYQLVATELANLPVGLLPYLRDAATGQTLPLALGQGYAFSVSVTQATALLTGRFTVVFRPGQALAATPAALAAGVSVYPNPAGRTGVTVEVPAVAGASQVQAELLNDLGQVVRRQQAALPATGARLALPTAGLAAGVYVLRLTAGDATATKRLIIE